MIPSVHIIRIAVVPAAALALTAASTPTAHAASTSPKITSIVVNAGKPVHTRPGSPKTFTITITAKDDNGIASADVWVYRWNKPGFSDGEKTPACKRVNSTVTTCTQKFLVKDLLSTPSVPVPSVWVVAGAAAAVDGGFDLNDPGGHFIIRH